MVTLDAMLVGVLVGIVAQTGALFYWGGAVRQILKEHERRITQLELVKRAR